MPGIRSWNPLSLPRFCAFIVKCVAVRLMQVVGRHRLGNLCISVFLASFICKRVFTSKLSLTSLGNQMQPVPLVRNICSSTTVEGQEEWRNEHFGGIYTTVYGKLRGLPRLCCAARAESALRKGGNQTHC
jgi:hypothetical protein